MAGTSHNPLRPSRPLRQSTVYLLFLLVLAVLVFAITQVSSSPVTGSTAVDVFNSFIGIMLQGIAFLIVGVLLSSAVRIFIPVSFFERVFGAHADNSRRSVRYVLRLVSGMCAAVLCGLLLPVCDCAVIPLFASLVRKRVPLPAAVTFLLCAPVANPIVVWSTYYSFNGSWAAVLQRSGYGILVSVVVGMLFALFPVKYDIFKKPDSHDSVNSADADNIQGPSTGHHHKKVPEKATCAQMLTIYLEDARDEFFSVGGYLLIGALIASALGASALTAVLKSWPHGSGTLPAGLVLLAVMMLAGFVMSVCSSSDAVIGRSFSTYIPFDSVLGFLVFGPMMDIKNVLMLQSRFNRRFIMRLVLSVAGTCFAAMAVRLVVVMI